ncbi:hypothetical protein RGD00_17515 [Xinfangfangia sp. LG-4]|uniref:Proline utilization A proline dehydrogenase N-terminal domain-containing protein n=1 Tax=Ruixingdingia sedimenti TaxID=3073604 RepID=A0ABU1FC22_9RHOB|nr:hypothetical protein [Xinfangfangia sp. LG-4]MDR5654415.1 hypothetical protein [Xinfangfangia sp. LG-4]
MTDLPPWDIIAKGSLTDEEALVRRLLDQAALGPEDRAAIAAAGADLVRRIRGATRPGLMEVFLAEYGLSRHIPLQDMKIGAANRGLGHPHDHVGGFFNDRFCLFDPVFLAGSLIDERFHSRFLLGADCPMSSDIPQVACRLTSRSPDFARWASVQRPERCLSSRKRPKSGGSSLEPAAFWPGRAAFPRGRRTCPAAFVQLGHGSWSCA